MPRRLPKSNVVPGRVKDLKRYFGRVHEVPRADTYVMNVYEQFGRRRLLRSKLSIDQDKVTSRGKPFRCGDVVEIWTWTGTDGERIHVERPRLPAHVLKRPGG